MNHLKLGVVDTNQVKEISNKILLDKYMYTILSHVERIKSGLKLDILISQNWLIVDNLGHLSNAQWFATFVSCLIILSHSFIFVFIYKFMFTIKCN
jgi:hypothetical protein